MLDDLRRLVRRPFPGKSPFTGVCSECRLSGDADDERPGFAHRIDSSTGADDLDRPFEVQHRAKRYHVARLPAPPPFCTSVVPCVLQA